MLVIDSPQGRAYTADAESPVNGAQSYAVSGERFIVSERSERRRRGRAFISFITRTPAEEMQSPLDASYPALALGKRVAALAYPRHNRLNRFGRHHFSRRRWSPAAIEHPSAVTHPRTD